MMAGERLWPEREYVMKLKTAARTGTTGRR